MKDALPRVAIGVVRRLPGAIPASKDDRVVWDALVEQESDGIISGIGDLVELVADRLAREYRRLWYVDGGLWGPSLSGPQAAAIVRAADGRLFEIL